mgnify:CR=1 FL=1
MEINPKHIIAELVEELGSQAAVAAHLGIGRSYVGDLLRGDRRASDSILRKLRLRRIVVSARPRVKTGR